MKIIEPNATLWRQGDDPVGHVARCARVCFGGHAKSSDTALYESLKRHGHLSMFRHESVYAAVPRDGTADMTFDGYESCPYVSVRADKKHVYVATNMNFILDHTDSHPAWDDVAGTIMRHRVAPDKFAATGTGRLMMRLTFHITTQISTSRELNRTSPNSIAELSTRHIDASDGRLCRPCWLDDEDAEAWSCHDFSGVSPVAFEYLQACEDAFKTYTDLRRRGVKKQDARGVLPLDTATEVIYTYSVSEWRRIIALRTAPSAHPNCQIVANMVKAQLQQLGYNFDSNGHEDREKH